MIDFLNKHIPLLYRIRLVYYLVGVETIAIGLYLFITFSGLADQLQSYTQASKQAQQSYQLAINAEQTQRNADTFIESGNQASADQVHLVHKDMQDITAELNLLALGDKSELNLKAIQQHMHAYLKTFKQVEKERFRQSDLVQQQMTDTAQQARSQIRNLMATLPRNAVAAELEAQKALNRVIMAEKQAYLYFNRLNITYFEQALQHLIEAQNLLATFPAPLSGMDLETTLSSLGAFEKALVEAVQRTRGYLYLLNVVMAAEISEILYHSQAIAQDQTRQMQQIREQIEDKLITVVQSALVFGLIFYLTIMMLSSTMGRSITRPIHQLTEAFQLLTKGATDAKIPSFHSKDEIGQLAEAAEVFKQKNADTQALLTQYQALSSELESKVKQRTQQLEDKNRELLHLSTTDPLTGVVNRMKLEQSINQELAKAKRYQLPYSVILIDIDHFKEVNDKYGHQAGDLVLQSFTALLKQEVRESDLVGRWGGEEFVISCSCTNLESGAKLAEKLRQKVASHDYGNQLTCTASFGVASYHKQDSLEKLLSRADTALYQSKSAGRNRVTTGHYHSNPDSAPYRAPPIEDEHNESELDT